MEDSPSVLHGLCCTAAVGGGVSRTVSVMVLSAAA